MQPADSGPAVAAGARLWWVVAPFSLALALMVLELTSDLDRAVTRHFFDADVRAFPWRYAFALEVVMHQWAKYAVITVGALIAARCVLSYVLPEWQAQRRIFLFLFFSLALAPLSVTFGKALSSRHCPWDIDEFGGLAPYTRLLEPLDGRARPGHCFPAGHASTGFALMAFYFGAYALGKRRAARAALFLGIVAGLVLGFGRVAQGAHFASHVLWSGIVCWAVMVLLYVMAFASRGRSHRRRPGTLRTAPQDSG